MRQACVVVGVLLSIGLVGCHRSSAAPQARATAPAPCTVALAAGAGLTDRDRDIARAQDAARSGVHRREALERLGYQYVARARVSNDPGDYKLAEMTAECLDSEQPGDAGALLLRGHVFHQLHRFRDAEQIARALVAKRDVALDYGLLGDALMEQGRLTDAAAAYQKMIDLRPFYQSYTRASHLRWLKGDLDGAIAAMQLAIDAASPRDPESSAWAWTRMAIYRLQAGRLDDALSAAQTAIRFQPDYAAALLAQGRTLLAMHRAPEALDVLRRAVRLNPLPEYQWIFADTLRRQGLDAEAEVVEQLLVARGAATDPRTLALYLATRRAEPAKALTLAEEELRTRADVFTLDAHAWTLAANGRSNEARDVMVRALAEGTKDARLFLHAGLICAAAGDRDQATRWLKQAEAMQATLLPSESAELMKHLPAARAKARASN